MIAPFIGSSSGSSGHNSFSDPVSPCFPAWIKIHLGNLILGNHVRFSMRLGPWMIALAHWACKVIAYIFPPLFTISHLYKKVKGVPVFSLWRIYV